MLLLLLLLSRIWMWMTARTLVCSIWYEKEKENNWPNWFHYFSSHISFISSDLHWMYEYFLLLFLTILTLLLKSLTVFHWKPEHYRGEKNTFPRWTTTVSISIVQGVLLTKAVRQLQQTTMCLLFCECACSFTYTDATRYIECATHQKKIKQKYFLTSKT